MDLIRGILYLSTLQAVVIAGEELNQYNISSDKWSIPGNIQDTFFNDMEVTFKLFNRNYPNGIRVASNDTDQKLSSAFIKNIETKFITHGYLETEYRSSVVYIARAYNSTSEYNVVTVDWSDISMSTYFRTTFRVDGVGAAIGIFVIRLCKSQLIALDRVHLIGHSLGAHVMGIAGGYIRNCGHGKVARITGLDAAGPGYEMLNRPEDSRLDIEDAEHVMNIHTDSGVLGYKKPMGHADFFPNGGSDQPNCTLNSICSHQRSYKLFAESIYRKDAFPATKCDSYERFLENGCANGEVVFMGDSTPSSAHGTYFLTTNFTGNNSDFWNVDMFDKPL